jgi:hypothetical protein
MASPWLVNEVWSPAWLTAPTLIRFCRRSDGGTSSVNSTLLSLLPAAVTKRVSGADRIAFSIELFQIAKIAAARRFLSTGSAPPPVRDLDARDAGNP